MAVENQNVNTQYQKPSFLNKAGGTFAGYMTTGVTLGAVIPNVSKFCMEKMGEVNNNLSSDVFEPVRKNMDKIIKDTGLDKKGVSVVRATAENEAIVKDIINKDMNSGIARFLPKNFKNAQKAGILDQLRDGVNAFFSPKANKVVVPQKGVELAFFHEVGHALNANKSVFTKILQKCRPLSVLALPILLIGLFKTKKAEGEQPKNGVDKVTTFVKDNSAALAFASFVPMLAEEGLATLKGNKLAKQYLDSDIAKKVAKTNRYGFISYLGVATAFSLATFVGTKVKDAITKTKTTQTA